MSKQKVSARAVVADIRSGISDADLMEKYNLTSKGLESLFAKLIVKNVLTAEEISGRGDGQSRKGETVLDAASPAPAQGIEEPSIDPKLAAELADHVRKGTHKNELMVKFGLSPSQLQNLMEELVRAGYVTAEELDANKPRKTRQCPHCLQSIPERDGSCPLCGQDPNLPPLPAEDELPESYGESTTSGHVEYDRYCAWEDRGNQGTVKGYIQTASNCLLSPDDFFSKLPLDAGYFSPVLFSAMSIVVAVLFTSLWVQILHGGAGAVGLIGLMFLLSITFVLSLLFIPIGLFVWSLLVHGILVLLKAAQSGFQATFRVACYSSVTSAFSAIPVVGNLASLWGLYLSVVGLRETHETTTGKAATAVLIPFSVFALIGILSWAGLWHSGSAGKSARGHDASIASQHGKGALPSKTCAAIDGFVDRVETATAQGTAQGALPVIRAAVEELNGELKKLPDQQRANEVRQKAVIFANMHLTFMALQEKVGKSSIPNADEKLQESRSALGALCDK